MFDKLKMKLETSNDKENFDGVLDLSLPKRQNRQSSSDGCSSPEAGPSSSSAPSSASSVDGEENQSETESFKSGHGWQEFAGDLSRSSSNSTGIHDEDRSDDSPPCQKRRRPCFPALPVGDIIDSPSTFSRNVPTFGDAAIELADDQPIRYTQRGVTLDLHDETLWNAFRKVGTEMIINRGGRRMFPHVILSVTGLKPSATYSIFLEVALADDRRFKYINNQWMGMGMADPSPGTKTVVHPDSPNTGAYWMQTRISFSKVRLTNNKDSSEDNILLLSMHKYKVVIKIRNESSSPFDDVLTFVLDESSFIAVTAYQNNRITQLKIQNNPFAKAFRDAPHKQKADGKRKNSGTIDRLENDFSTANVSTYKKSQMTSTPKDKSDLNPSLLRWDPWFMAGLGSRIGAGQLPHMFDLQAQAYEGFGRPGVLMNPALMSPYSYFPFFSMGQHLGQKFPKPDTRVYLDRLERSSTMFSPIEGANERRDLVDSDSGSKSSSEDCVFH